LNLSDWRTRSTKEVEMKIIAASIVIGSLMLIGALPGAGQSSPAPAASAPVGSATGGDTTTDRASYTQKARDDMQEWERKLHDFSVRAESNGKEADNAADTDLHKAWTRTEAVSRRLQTVGAEGWDRARTSFEQASRDLAAAWGRVRHQE
jgi:hypothetical protein